MTAVFLKLLDMSAAAGWLILAVILLRLPLKKAPKWVRCVLWALVAVRLVCPVSPESALSLIPDAGPVSERVAEAVVRIDPDRAVSAAGETAAAGLSGEPGAAVMTEPGPVLRACDVAAAVWAAGVVILLLYALVSWLRLRRRVRAAMLARDGVWLSDEIASPFILGVFRPRIYLPSDLAGEELEYVLAHERAHLARRDHWWKPVGYLLLVVYWFNPLIWPAYILLCRDIELACDEKVVKTLDPAGRKAYSQTLVSRSVSRRTVAACPLAFGEVGIKARVKSALSYKKPAFWIILVAAMACIVLAVCFLTDPVKPVSDDVMRQTGYRITGMVTGQSMDVRIPVDAISEDAWTEEGHGFEPDEVVLGQIGGTTLYLERIQTIGGGTDEEYLFFVLNLSHEISDRGMIRTTYEPEIKNGKTTAFISGMDLLADEVRDSAATYEDAGCYRGHGPGDTICVGVKRGVVRSAADYISFRLRGFTDITYEKGDAGRGDDILIRTAREVAEGVAKAVWIDGLEEGDLLSGASELILPEYPDTTFLWHGDRVEAVPDGKSEGAVLFSGGTIWNVYLADLTGDGCRDFCATVSDGSGGGDTSVLVHDYVAGVTFGLADCGPYNYVLNMVRESGSRLFGSALQVTCSDPETGEPVAVGTLKFTSDGLTMVSNAGVEFGTAIAAEFGNVPDDYRVYYNSEIEDAIGFMDYLQIKRSLDLTYGDTVPTYFLSPDKKTLIAVKQDKEGTKYSWTFVKDETGEWELAGEILTKPAEKTVDAGKESGRPG